jgi:hypothetical protein
MDIHADEKCWAERGAHSFLSHFFVFWIAQRVAFDVVHLLALERGREARHIRKYIAEVSRS